MGNCCLPSTYHGRWQTVVLNRCVLGTGWMNKLEARMGRAHLGATPGRQLNKYRMPSQGVGNSSVSMSLAQASARTITWGHLSPGQNLASPLRSQEWTREHGPRLWSGHMHSAACDTKNPCRGTEGPQDPDAWGTKFSPNSGSLRQHTCQTINCSSRALKNHQ